MNIEFMVFKEGEKSTFARPVLYRKTHWRTPGALQAAWAHSGRAPVGSGHTLAHSGRTPARVGALRARSGTLWAHFYTLRAHSGPRGRIMGSSPPIAAGVFFGGKMRWC